MITLLWPIIFLRAGNQNGGKLANPAIGALVCSLYPSYTTGKIGCKPPLWKILSRKKRGQNGRNRHPNMYIQMSTVGNFGHFYPDVYIYVDNDICGHFYLMDWRQNPTKMGV